MLRVSGYVPAWGYPVRVVEYMSIQTSDGLWPNLLSVDRGSKKLVMDKVSWGFTEDLIRSIGIHLPFSTPFGHHPPSLAMLL